MKAISAAEHQRFVLVMQDAFRTIGEDSHSKMKTGISGVQQLYEEYEHHLGMLHKVINDYQQAHRSLRMEFKKQKAKARIDKGRSRY